MIDPRSQFIIYKEQETELMNQIERKLAAQERRKIAVPSQHWYTAVEQRLKAVLVSLRLAKNPCLEEEPC
jgi:hypothetical protein